VHTPFPWHIKYRVNIFGADDRLVASTGGFRTNVDDGEHILENEANAILISRIPEMVDALVDIASGPCCESPGCTVDDPSCDTMRARAALRLGE